MGKKVLITLCVVLFLMTNSFAIDETLKSKLEIELSIENENLFINFNSSVGEGVQKIVIQQGIRGKIILNAVLIEDSNAVFYLDASQANRIRKFGIKSIKCIYQDGSEIKISDIDQVEKITRSLP